jgi:hypothetical protein
MNLDDIIPILIFLGIILFNIFKGSVKKKQAAKVVKTSKKPKRKSVFGLSKLVDNIKAEIEKAGIEANQDKTKQSDSIWATLSDKVGTERKELVSDSGEVARSEAVDFESPPTIESVPELYDEPIRQVLEAEKETAPKISPETLSVGKRKFKKSLGLSPSKMREAIVLSEIVAKPIGLRDYN